MGDQKFLYSFDVFDTLITRKTATPRGIFKVMEKVLAENSKYVSISDYVKNNFYDLRVRTEQLARVSYCFNDIQDVTLSQIYDGFIATGYVSKEQARLLEMLEIETELAHVLGIQENIEAVKKLQQDGYRVVLISDMYLSAETIRSMLAIADPLLAELPLYVSSEYAKNKWNGSLYCIVKEQEKADYLQWIHTGDNPYSDVEVPQRLGIKAHQFCFEELHDIEKYVIEREGRNSYAEYAAGASRYIRQENRGSKSLRVGITAGANILLPYVLWLLKESAQRGVNRLYFVARDGYILKKIADRIIEIKGYPIRTEYIYGSRKAWRLPGISKKNNDIVTLVNWSHTEKIDTLAKLADVFEMTESELLPFLPQGFDRQIRFVSYTLYITVCQLDRNEDFKKYLMQKYKKERELVKKYLMETIDLHDNHFAFVELTGGGYTQKCLANLLGEILEEQTFDTDREIFPIKTFYFKMDRLNPWKECQQLVFLPEDKPGYLILEMVCRAYHGKTVGYEEKDGKILPVLDKEGELLLNYGYNEYIDGIVKYTKYVCERNPDMVEQGESEGFRIASLYLTYLLESGESEEFLYYADMPNNETGREEKIECFAPLLTDEQIEKIYYSERFKNKDLIYHGSCFAASLQRCSKEQQQRIEAFRKKAEEENRSAALDEKKRKTFENSFPVGVLGKRIVLYGAGRYGNCLYDILYSDSRREVVQWIDQKHRQMVNAKMRIEGLDKLGREQYDCVLIAVVAEKTVMEIRENLLRHGIPDYKIYWLGRDDVNRYVVWSQWYRWM